MQGHVYDFRYLTIIEKETSRTKQSLILLQFYYWPTALDLKQFGKKPKAKKNIDRGHLNSASFGQRLPGSNSLSMAFKKVTNKLFWTYNNINK